MVSAWKEETPRASLVYLTGRLTTPTGTWLCSPHLWALFLHSWATLCRSLALLCTSSHLNLINNLWKQAEPSLSPSFHRWRSSDKFSDSSQGESRRQDWNPGLTVKCRVPWCRERMLAGVPGRKGLLKPVLHFGRKEQVQCSPHSAELMLISRFFFFLACSISPVDYILKVIKD